MLVLLLIVFVTVLSQLRRQRSDLALLSEGYLVLSQEIAGASTLSPEPEATPASVEQRSRTRRVDSWIFKRIEGHLTRADRISDAMLREPLREEDRTAQEPIAARIKVTLRIADELRDTHALFVQATESVVPEALDGAPDPTLEDPAGPDPSVHLPRLLALEADLDRNLSVLTDWISRRITRVVGRTRATQADAVVVAGSVFTAAFLLSVLLLVSTHFALRPIRRLTASAERIRAGRFDERVSVETRDEIGRLARSFNSMAASIEERETALESRSEQLEQALQDLRTSQDRAIRTERLAAIGHMAAQIAHEVRNPLNALGLNADVLGDEIREGNVSEAEDLLAAIRNEIRRLAEITEAYLSVGRLSPLRVETQPIGPIVDELVRFQAEELGHNSVTVETDLAPGLPEIAVDADQLRQALLNILRNASDALAAQGGGHVRFVGRLEAPWLLLEIADDGAGMDAEHVERIFDPFFSTKATGSGLGLPLTQQIVAEHGGRIACISSPGVGTTFSIRLPVEPAERSTRPVP